MPSLLSLYAISKTFHYLFNAHPAAFVMASVRTWAPGSDETFPWRSYRGLCLKDPEKRVKITFQKGDGNVADAGAGAEWRDMPSLRWLQMVVWRHGVAEDCLIQLAVNGLGCTKGTLDAVKVT